MADIIWRTTTAVYELIYMKFGNCFWLRCMLIIRLAKYSKKPNQILRITTAIYESIHMKLVNSFGWGSCLLNVLRNLIIKMADPIWWTPTAIYESIQMILGNCVWLSCMVIKRSAKFNNQYGGLNMADHYRYLWLDSYQTKESDIFEDAD